MNIDELYEILKSQKSDDFSAKKIAKKMGEEAVELAIAATSLHHKEKSEKRQDQVREEAADVMQHYLTLLAHFDIAPKEILQILKNRLGKS